MTRITISAVVMMATSHAAFAGPVEVPPPLPPVIVETCPLSFDCFYGGLELGYGMGEGTEDISPTLSRTLDYDGHAYGAFAGYNVQNGAMIYGGELRYLHLNLEDATTGVEFNDVLDIRARLGYAVSDQSMVYGAAGYSVANATAITDFDMTGFNYGVGAEYNLSESFFLGVDLTGRDLEGTSGVLDLEGTVNTATLRIGFRF